MDTRSDLEKSVDEALNIAFSYGQIDGAHHKTWVIDQMVRALTGKDYDTIIGKNDPESDDYWDVGIAP